MKFNRAISPFGLLLAGIGSIIGSGWLFGPLYAAQIAGPAAIISWIVGGLLMMIIVLTFAELGTAFPVAGGMVRYAQYSHGPLVSFVTGWMVWISSVAVAPVETMALIQYTANYIPNLVTKVNNVTILTSLGILSSAVIMFLMCVLNYQGARFFNKSNNLITIIKLIVPISTALLLLFADFHHQNFVFTQSGGFAPYGWQGILSALPLGGVIYSFIGSSTVLQMAGESKNPHFSIPFALLGSIIFCIVLYVLLQIAFVGALEPSTLIQGWKHLSYKGDSGPFAGILVAFGLTWFVVVLYGDALISPFGTGFIYTTATARVSYGLSQIGFFPKFFKKLTKKGVPLRGVIVNYLVGLILFLPFPGWQEMISFIISCFIVSYIVGPIALIGLRKTNPEQPRPFRLPCAYFMALLAFYICNLLIFWTGWQTVYHVVITMGIGFVVFIIHCCRLKNNLLAKQWQNSWWIFPYFIGMCIISYLGNFGGGKGIISFGTDFAVMAVFTIIMFVLAVKLNTNCKAFKAT